MAYLRSEMVFNDYKWTARADKDKPTVRFGRESTMLNKQEGYEVLDFINRYADKRKWTNGTTGKIEPASLHTYQKIEKMIRAMKGQTSHEEAEKSISDGWASFKS